MTEVTQRDLAAFMGLSESYMRMPDAATKKITHALKRQRKLVQKMYDDLQEKLEESSINLASVDDKGNLVTSGTNYVYTPTKRLELSKKHREELDKKVSVENYFATEIPSDLPYDFKKAFTDFVIKSEVETEESEKKEEEPAKV